MNTTIETKIKWFHEDACQACSEGLNERMRQLTEQGLSLRKAAQVMSEESSGELSADNIRKRFSYYNSSKSTKVGKSSHKGKKHDRPIPTL